MPGEFDLIQWIVSQKQPSPLIQLGVGDDLAVLKWPASDLLLAGVDQVLDGVHFDSAIHTPHQIGRKAMNRNLSDCAAMACLPAAALIAVALPVDFSIDRAKELYLGVAEAAKKFDCAIVGGDTATWPGKLAVSVSILGRSAGHPTITRAGAKPGDSIYVTGPLGGSILGRHMTFTPKIPLGCDLAAVATSMIDLSDGLSRDLRQICTAGRVGAIMDADAVPIHADAIELSRRDGKPPLEHALHDGEDYELLFTSSRTPPHGIRIGRMIEGHEILLSHKDGKPQPLAPKGWEHSFKS